MWEKETGMKKLRLLGNVTHSYAAYFSVWGFFKIIYLFSHLPKVEAEA